jgi:hypothetical protein
MSTPNDSAPGFNIQKETSIRMPILMLIALITAIVSAAIVWLNLSHDVSEQARINVVQDGRCQRLEESLVEERRVNNAQDKRFENIESAQREFSVMRNDMEWLKRNQESTRR